MLSEVFGALSTPHHTLVFDPQPYHNDDHRQNAKSANDITQMYEYRHYTAPYLDLAETQAAGDCIFAQ